MGDFIMPSLGADMENGTLLEWLVQPGEQVERGQAIAVVGTEKGEIEAEVWEEGVIGTLVVTEGMEVPVGAVLAHIQAAGATTTAAEEAVVKEVAATSAATAPAGSALGAIPREAVSPDANGHRVRISPLARKLAAELGVDPTQILGTGPHHAVSRSDVERAAASKIAPPPAPQEVAQPPSATAPTLSAEGVPAPAAPKPAAKEAKKKAADDFQRSMRKAIAAAMTRANADIPHYYLETRIDMQAALRWLEAENLQRSIKDRVLPAVLLIKAVAKGLAKVPALNGFWVDNRLQPAEGIHIGFAIALRQGGLITPAIHHADLQGMDELMAAMRDLIMRTRAGRLRGSEMTDATITLTSLGDMGVEKVFGVIYPPQVALVGFGRIADEVWVENGLLGVRPIVHATLAGDHRASDGRTGAEFLDELTRLLQEPAALWE